MGNRAARARGLPPAISPLFADFFRFLYIFGGYINPEKEAFVCRPSLSPSPQGEGARPAAPSEVALDRRQGGLWFPSSRNLFLGFVIRHSDF